MRPRTSSLADRRRSACSLPLRREPERPARKQPSTSPTLRVRSGTQTRLVATISSASTTSTRSCRRITTSSSTRMFSRSNESRSWSSRSHPNDHVRGVTDVIETTGADGSGHAPLLVLDRLEAFLDEQGLGEGPIRAQRIGDGGGSNFSFLLERGGERYVLRRPPRPPLPPSAHDMVREARLQLALAPHGIRLPPIVAVCEDESVLGVPFYVMRYLDGHVVSDTLPPGLGAEAARRRLGEELVDALVAIHAADVTDPALAAFARPGSY